MRVRLAILTGFVLALAATGLAQDAVQKKLRAVQGKYDIVKAQWYDIYELGLVPGADEAGKLLESARQALAAGDGAKAKDLLGQADQMLSVYSKTDLPPFDPAKPLANPADLGKIRKAEIADMNLLAINGLPRWNYWFNFSGRGADGKLYGFYACVNYHGTPGQTPPILVVVSTQDKPDKPDDYSMKTVAKRTEAADKLTFAANEGGSDFLFEIGRDKVRVVFKNEKFSADLTLATKFSFWYNKGDQPVMVVPGSPGAGFEEPGLASGEMVFAGKKVKVKGFAELENYFCGGPGAADYRTALFKYGNEWWVPFAAGDVAGIFVCTGPYKDAGLWLDGQYVIPSSFRIIAGEAKKSFTIAAKTAKGDLNLTFHLWGWNPALMEYWGTVEATFKGKKLPTGYCWLEHVPQIQMASHPGGRKTATGQK